MAQKAIIIDGNWLIYRAYYARLYHLDPSEHASSFFILVFMIKNSLKDLLKKNNYAYNAVVFDTTRKTFRQESFPNYKANRKKTPDLLIKYNQWIKNEIQLLNFAVIDSPKTYEADDVISSISSWFVSENIEVDIFTSDRDLLQLVSSEVSVWLFSSKSKNFVCHSSRNFQELNDNLSPHQIPHLKALSGDASDNFPGVKGIGVKTAVSLLNEYGNVYGIFENLEKINEKMRDKLSEAREDIFFFLKLASIVNTVEITKDLSIYMFDK